MGKIDIKDTLQKKFDAPVEDFHERRIVFWEDSQGSYDSYVNTLSLENVAIRKQTKSNQFVLKKELLIDHPKENYLIYRSFSPVGEENWLEDIEIYSEAFRADFISNLMEECQRAEYPSLRSSFQKYEKFFKGQKRKEAFLRFASQVQSPEKMDMAILAVLTGSDRLNFPSILFSLFSKGFAEEENEAYQNILRFGDVDAFWDMMQRATGYGSEERKLSDSFKTILVSAVGYDIHDTLWPRKYPTFYQEETGEYCSALIRAFFQEEKMRNSEALSSLIMEAEEELSFASVLEELSFASLIQSDVFPSFDYRLLKEICERLSKDCIQPEEVRDLLEKRKNSHWYFKVHDIVEALIPAVCFFEEEKKETFQMKGMTEVFNAYRDRLYRYDTYYRHFHQKDKAVRNTIPPQLEDSYKDVEDALEKQYKNDFLKKLSDQWLLWSKEALMQEGKIPSAIDQTHFYEREVEKKINSRTLTAILISDGLRYEVARELHDRLSGTDKAQVTIEGMEGVFPSITTFGMAALLPGRKTIGPNGEILVDNLPCGNLQQRRAILQKSCAQSDAILVKDFLGWKTIERQAFLKGKSLVYFYHDEIDNAGEHGLDVFSACEDAIQTLEKTIQTISDIRKGATILVTSDHGFLYNASPLDETEKAWRSRRYFSTVAGLFSSRRSCWA